MTIIIPCELGVLGYAVVISNPTSEWFTTKYITTEMYFSLTEHVSLGCREHCWAPSQKLGHRVTAWTRRLFLHLLFFYASLWSGCTPLLPSVNCLPPVTASYTAPLVDKGVGRFRVSITVSIVSHCKLYILLFYDSIVVLSYVYFNAFNRQHQVHVNFSRTKLNWIPWWTPIKVQGVYLCMYVCMYVCIYLLWDLSSFSRQN